MNRCGWIPLLLSICAGCVHVPVSSDIGFSDRLQAVAPLEHGEVLLIFGDDASPPKEPAASPYFTAGCVAFHHGRTLDELAERILKVNPDPGRFAVRRVSEAPEKTAGERTTTDFESIRSRLGLSGEMISKDRLRYAVHVKETFEYKVHLPLYIVPFGIASCGNRTALEARIWDLSAGKDVGSLSIEAEGEYTVVAWMLHLVVFRDTQDDAIERLARTLVERLAGVKPSAMGEE